MKSDKKFDCVKMMRDIRDRISSDIKDMSPEQILEYIKTGRNDFEKIITDHQQDNFSKVPNIGKAFK